MIEVVKDFKPVIIEKEHAKIVELWAIIKNNAHRDLEKCQQNIQWKILPLMMLLKILIWVGKVKGIDGMDMMHRCINK